MLYLKEDLELLVQDNKLMTIPGVGRVINNLICEIVNQRKCSYYENLLYSKVKKFNYL